MDESEDQAETEKKVEEKTYEDRPLLDVMRPKHIYPLGVLPSFRSTENISQPMLFAPYPHPFPLPPGGINSANTLWCQLCASYADEEPRRKEGTWEIETYGKDNYMRSKSIGTTKKIKNDEESEHLLGEEKHRRRRGLNHQDPSSEEEVAHSGIEMPDLYSDEDDGSFATEVQCPIRAEEGLYTGRSAHLTPLLLSPEPVDAPIGLMLTQNIFLSRATQRLLRELHGNLLLHYVRLYWSGLHNRDDCRSVTDNINNLMLDRETSRKSKRGEFIENWSEALSMLSSFRCDGQPHGHAQLLRDNYSNPTMRLLDNFIDYRILQQIHPTSHFRSHLNYNQDPNSQCNSGFLGHIFSPDGISGIQEKKGFTLKILAQELILMDHPYMSIEEQQHVELRKLYAQYVALYQNKSKTYLPYRLLALITELKHLVERQHEGHLSLHEEKSNMSSIFRLYNDLVETLPGLCEFKVAWQQAATAVYGQWRKILEIRKQQGFISTRAQLVARKVTHDEISSSGSELGGNRYHWSRLQEALHDLPQLVSDIHQFEEHKDNAAIAKHNHDEERSSVASSENGAPSHNIAQRTSAPDAHRLVLEQKAQNRNKAKALFTDCIDFLTDSEESISFLPSVVYRLANIGNVTPDEEVPPSEETRRNKLRRLSIRVDLRVSGRVLASTVPQPLIWPGLRVDLSKLFEMRIFRKPTDIILDIYSMYTSRHGSILDTFSRHTHVASVGVPLAQISNNGVSANSGMGLALPALCFSPIMGWYHFNSSQLMTASKGRGINYDPNGKRASKVSDIRVEGVILCGSEYDVEYDAHSTSVVVARNAEGVHGSDLAFVTAGQHVHQRSLNRVSHGHAEFTQEKDFFELLPPLENIDTNDPRNDNVVALQQHGIVSGRLNQRNIFQLGGEHFTVMHKEGGISYGQYLRLQPSNRLKLLRLREVKPYLFTFPIPLSEEDIKKSEVLKNLLIRELPGESSRALRALPHASEIDKLGLGEAIGEEDQSGEIKNRKKVVSFLQRVRDSQTALSRKTRRKQIVTQSVLYEPNHGIGVLSFEEVVQKNYIPERKRALRPKGIDRTPIAAPTTACEFLVQVVGARNVPLRAVGEDEPIDSKKGSGGRYGGHRGGDYDTASLLEKRNRRDTRLVRSFVEVSFQERKVSTTTMDGQNPMWKQSLSLPFYPPQGDFSHANLELIHDDVIFTLFDEHEVDDAARGGFLEGENTTRREKTYLGSFSVPFSSILSQQKVEGTFRLNAPPYVNGYKRKAPYKPKPQLPPRTFLEMIGLGSLIKFQEKDTLTSVDDDIIEELDWYSCGPTSTYITIMATLDPLLSSSPYIDSEFSRATTYPPDRPLVSYTQGWLQSLRSKGLHTKNRKFKCFGTNSDGLSVLVCRYLTAQKPPPGFSTRRSIIHLVSMIPFIEDSAAFVGEFDLWCTMKQMWEIMGGDEEEHAIALYNFLYYLSIHSEGAAKVAGKDSKNNNEKAPYAGYPSPSYVASEELFLVMGHSVPQADAVYVMIRAAGRNGRRNKGKRKDKEKLPKDNGLGTSAQDFIIVDPATGYVYSVADANCPLRDIGTIATPYNVWANVQRQTLPKDLSYDVMDPKKWKPLFSARFRPQISNLSSCQDDVVYSSTEKITCLEVEKVVKSSIKTSFRKWRSRRPRSVTSFHPDACDIMTDSLEEMEEWKMNGLSNNGGRVDVSSGGSISDAVAVIESQALRRLAPILRSHTIRGFPLNLPFTDVDAIVQKVKDLRVHENNHPDAQFVLAVRAFPLVNGLISLWVYIGTLERERV